MVERFELEQEEIEPLPMNNTANGLKQIGIICLLLKNRKLVKDSILIMDEPEIHLHPEWQMKLAEIIVILAKELNITSYINSHSPQFIEAIEVFSMYYDMKKDNDFTLNDVNYYLTQYDEESKKYNINKVERENLADLYNSLAKPYDDLDYLRGKIEANY